MPFHALSHPLAAAFAALPLLAIAGADAAQAQSRQLDAHVHGESVLAIAVDGARVVIELDAPGMDIVGFERTATSEADKAAVEAARETLADPVAVFGIPAAAGCEVVSMDVAFATEDEHGHEAGEPADHDHADNDHADHDDAGHDHAENGDADRADAGEHAAFEARYELSCASPDQLDGLDVTFFELFPDAALLDVTVVTAGGQMAAELSRDTTDIAF